MKAFIHPSYFLFHANTFWEMCRSKKNIIAKRSPNFETHTSLYRNTSIETPANHLFNFVRQLHNQIKLDNYDSPDTVSCLRNHCHSASTLMGQASITSPKLRQFVVNPENVNASHAKHLFRDECYSYAN